jgi:hypothetical protein
MLDLRDAPVMVNIMDPEGEQGPPVDYIYRFNRPPGTQFKLWLLWSEAKRGRQYNYMSQSAILLSRTQEKITSQPKKSEYPELDQLKMIRTQEGMTIGLGRKTNSNERDRIVHSGCLAVDRKV